MFQLKEGAIHNIGASNKAATVKLYDVAAVEGRAFGDERVKLVARDDSGNEVEVALFPDELESLLNDIETVRSAGTVEGFTDGAEEP